MQGNFEECPLDRTSLGRAAWQLLHTIGAYYPDYPSSGDQRDMFLFINLFAKFYPCRECGSNFQKYIKRDPPDVRSRQSFAYWLCNVHNVVNKRLLKPQFDCYQTEQRWRTGWADGSCDY